MNKLIIVATCMILVVPFAIPFVSILIAEIISANNSTQCEIVSYKECNNICNCGIKGGKCVELNEFKYKGDNTCKASYVFALISLVSTISDIIVVVLFIISMLIYSVYRYFNFNNFTYTKIIF